MRARILIADDEESIRYTLSFFLESAGYEVESAESLADCRQKMRERVYDLLLLDIRLGPDNSIEAIDEFQSLQPDCRVVIITGHPHTTSLIEAIKSGARDYLTKPIYKTSLLYNVRKTLSATS